MTTTPAETPTDTAPDTATDISDLASRLATALPGEHRAIPAQPDTRFRIVMHNDSLTPRGRPYKWSEVAATLSRSVLAGPDAPTVWARYTWDEVEASTGTPEAQQAPRPWRFAHGQSFWSHLLNTRITSAAPGPGPDTNGQNGAQHDAADAAARKTLIEIAYPDLPGTPAVDMLLMLSWDVVTMEMLAGHMGSSPGLRTPGRVTNLNRISGTRADLQFAAAGGSGMFRNAQMTAAWLGVGLRGERPAGVFRYQCLDCELSVRTGPLEQRGRSSYWGTVEIDLATGDLVGAEMTEMILATLSGPDGDRVPVQTRRLVQMQVLDERHYPPEPAASSAPGPTRKAPRRGPAGHAVALAAYLRWQRDFIAGLPASVTPMFEMGFENVVGTDRPTALARIEEFAGRLEAWEGGDADAGERLRAAALGYREVLEGMLSFSTLAVEMAGTMEAQHAMGLRMLCELSADNHEHVSELLAVLDRLAG